MRKNNSFILNNKRNIYRMIHDQKNSLSKIRIFYNGLDNESLNYLKKETKTISFNDFLKYLCFSENEIYQHNLAYNRCIETGLEYVDYMNSGYLPIFLGVSKKQCKKIKEEKLLPSFYKNKRFYGRNVKVPYYDILYLIEYYNNNQPHKEI